MANSTGAVFIYILIFSLLCLFQLFNSRSCQIVLGAGALQTIGLRRISAKHLALVAQCLEVVIMHIHIIKNHFEVRIEPKQYVLLNQFDQILKVSFVTYVVF